MAPILFLIYINDLPQISPILKTIMFGDDTTLCFKNSDHVVVRSAGCAGEGKQIKGKWGKRKGRLK